MQKMLKLIDTSTAFNKPNKKCAEVFCHSANEFSIVCTDCELKTFDFCDFWMHFKNIHLQVPEPASFVQACIIKEEKCEEEVSTTQSSDIKPNVDAITDEVECELPISNFLNEDSNGEETEEFGKAESDCSFEYSCSDNDTDQEEEYVPKILKRKTQNTKTTKSNNNKNETNNEFFCDQCHKTYKSAKFLSQHMQKKHDISTGLPLKCNHCEETFETSSLLKSHVLDKHKNFPCENCDRVYKSKHLLRLHSYNHSGERQFQCDYENCGKAFFNPKLLSAHKRMVHTLAANYVCEVCGFRTKNNSALVVHKRSHTGERPYICKTCGKGFASPSLLSEHQPIHSTERPYICDVCGASFSRPKALYHHKHLHLGIKKFVCKICGKAYAQAAGLSGHMRHHKAELSLTNYKHNNPVQFVCKEVGCEKVFKSCKRLWEHRQRSHVLLAAFMCEFCGYRTSIRSNLMVHLRLHTNERSYSCQFCAKRFNTNSALNQHAAVHTEKRTYKCADCNLCFFNHQVLRHHTAVHAKQKQYKCHFCNRLFTQAAGRSQHMRWHRKQFQRVTKSVYL